MFGFIWRHQDQNMNIDCMVDNKGKTSCYKKIELVVWYKTGRGRKGEIRRSRLKTPEHRTAWCAQTRQGSMQFHSQSCCRLLTHNNKYIFAFIDAA